MQSSEKYLIVITGPTAVGKTALSIFLAKEFCTEIISADSRQFYIETSIGTAKPSIVEQAGVIHHFIDSHSIHEEFNVGQYESEAIKLLNKLFEKYTILILVGGSGLYIKAVLEGLDSMPTILQGVREELNKTLIEKGLNPLVEELIKLDPHYYNTVDKKNPQRIIRALEVIRSTGIPFSRFHLSNKKIRPFRTIKLGIELPRETLYERINSRMERMLEEGLIKEAEGLWNFKNLNALQTVGYKEVFDFLEGKYNYQDMVNMLKQNSRRFAKRQLTWFKRDMAMAWFDPSDVDKIVAYIREKLIFKSP